MKDYPYDASCDPPIPICDVTLMVPATGRHAELRAIVDTGADGTIVPIRYLQSVPGSNPSEATSEPISSATLLILVFAHTVLSREGKPRERKPGPVRRSCILKDASCIGAAHRIAVSPSDRVKGPPAAERR